MNIDINTWLLALLTFAFTVFKYFDIKAYNRGRERDKKYFRILAAMVDKLNHVANSGVAFRDAFMKSATGVDMVQFKQHMNERLSEDNRDDEFWKKMMHDILEDKK